MSILESKSAVVLVMIIFPSSFLFLSGSGGQFLLMCLPACLRDLITALPACAFIGQLPDQMQPCNCRQACLGPGHAH